MLMTINMCKIFYTLQNFIHFGHEVINSNMVTIHQIWLRKYLRINHALILWCWGLHSQCLISVVHRIYMSLFRCDFQKVLTTTSSILNPPCQLSVHGCVARSFDQHSIIKLVNKLSFDFCHKVAVNNVFCWLAHVIILCWLAWSGLFTSTLPLPVLLHGSHVTSSAQLSMGTSSILNLLRLSVCMVCGRYFDQTGLP